MWKVVLVLILVLFSFTADSQYFATNSTLVPYPYQTVLGLPSNQPGVPILNNPHPWNSNLGISWSPNSMGISNATLNSVLNSQLAQQGTPAYQYPLGFAYPQISLGYPQYFGYPYKPVVYPQPMYGMVNTYPLQIRMEYPQRSWWYPGMGLNVPEQGYRLSPTGTFGSIKTEIIDVSPEYQRQLMGWPEEMSSSGTPPGGQDIYRTAPKYDVKIDSHSTNFSSNPANSTKPIVAVKHFTTSIRRTFVYDSSKPGKIETINLHFVNGELVTTAPPPTTTENENVQEKNFTQKGRRFMDVPASCPEGTLPAHNGECLEPFLTLKQPSLRTRETTNKSIETLDENEIMS